MKMKNIKIKKSPCWRLPCAMLANVFLFLYPTTHMSQKILSPTDPLIFFLFGPRISFVKEGPRMWYLLFSRLLFLHSPRTTRVLLIFYLCRVLSIRHSSTLRTVVNGLRLLTFPHRHTRYGLCELFQK